MTNTTCTTNFVSCVTLFRIVVLTWNRPAALTRLLTSLENTFYQWEGSTQDPGWEVVLEIHVDGGGGEEGGAVRDIARNFQFSHGEKILVMKTENEGALEAWRSVWSWRDKELFLMVEDDAELSPWWYRWLANTWRAYGGRDDLAAISLYKQSYVVWPQPDMVDIGSKVDDHVFLYRLPALFANSPHPLHWHRFITDYGHQLGPCPPGIHCCGEEGDCKEKEDEKETQHYQDQDVEPWMLKYNLDKDLFTLYMADENTMALDHREEGHHYQNSFGPEHSKVEKWNIAWNWRQLPEKPARLDLWLKGGILLSNSTPNLQIQLN